MTMQEDATLGDEVESHVKPEQTALAVPRGRAAQLLDLLASAVTIAAVGVIGLRQIGGYGSTAVSTRRLVELPNVIMPLRDFALRRTPDAKVIIVEFSDFQCPYCGRFATATLPSIIKEYVESGKAAIGFRHLPLAVHPEASRAAAAAVCADRQGKFWETHDWLFARQADLGTEMFAGLPTALRLDADLFQRCLEEDGAKVVDSDLDAARNLGLKGTPSFVFGFLQEDGSARLVRGFSGARPIEEFRSVLDSLLLSIIR